MSEEVGKINVQMQSTLYENVALEVFVDGSAIVSVDGNVVGALCNRVPQLAPGITPPIGQIRVGPNGAAWQKTGKDTWSSTEVNGTIVDDATVRAWRVVSV